MIIKCSVCNKEFDKPSYRNQHENDAHVTASKSLSDQEITHIFRSSKPAEKEFGHRFARAIEAAIKATPPTVDQDGVKP